MPGTQLGPYEVAALIGRGGMGEVYRARDTKLDRAVAIKILPDSFAHDPDRVARFQREAKTLAALNHPNIGGIHGLEDANGLTALVMELVEGEDLAQRIERGAIPLDEALPIARQITDALAAAHNQGIIHRDLKPANIKVRPDGTVKVLDFGLAKALEPTNTVSQDVAGSPTITAAMTEPGIILGTAAYMSPEQARGKAVDKRADLWAFGCVLYEMLTGARAFQADEVSDTLAMVLTREPNWSRMPAATPLAVGTLLRRCLTKDRQRRLDSAIVARLEIDDALTRPSHETDNTPQLVAGARQRIASYVGIALLAALAGGFATWSFIVPPRTAKPVARFTIDLAAAGGLAVPFNNAPDVSLSRDGMFVVYSVGPQAQLMVRALDTVNAVPVVGALNARSPFFSPDGRWIGFFDQRGQLKRVSTAGGPPLVLCDFSGTSRGATWSLDNTIVFATSDTSTGLVRVPAEGGEPTVLTTLVRDKGDEDHLYPSVLPEDRGILYTVVSSRGRESQVAVLDNKTGQSRIVFRGSHARYVETGHVLYVVANTLWAVGFDLKTLGILGDATPVLQLHPPPNFSTSPSGTLVYVPARGVGLRTLVWMNRHGQAEPLAIPPAVYEGPRVSPDGTRVIATIRGRDSSDVWAWDASGQTPTRLTFDGGTYPVWTPDGKRIVFKVVGTNTVYRRAADGTGGNELLVDNRGDQRPTTISPEGTRLVLDEHTPKTAWDLMLLSLDGTPRTEPLLSRPFDERNGVISPDGRWLAYDSNESGQEDVFVRPFPNVNDAYYQISTGGGRTPLWAPNERELFFVKGTSLFSVSVQLAPTFRHGTATRLFDTDSIAFDARPQFQGSAIRMYDVSRDGQRFLMLKKSDTPPDESAPAGIILVQNWFEDLKRLAPPK